MFERERKAVFTPWCDRIDPEEVYQIGCELHQKKSDHKLVERIIRLAASAGHADAMCMMGVLYQEGQGVDRDDTLAVDWFRKAAEQGSTAAGFNYGLCLQNGTGIPKDEDLAALWYAKIFDVPDAQINLGALYDRRGESAKAVRCYREAADMGHAVAQHNLGCCYENGEGVEKDVEQAVSLYRKAADQGYAVAQCHLGKCYEYGVGVDQDFNFAAVWYRLAKSQGYPAAAECLQRVEYKIRKRCECCGKFQNTNSWCSGCERVAYCDADCQRKAWSAHRKECKK